ncbi:helix-turn-helix transcriptional regulator [Streptomyces sp. NPDC088353]|uniref:helix-turn-helix transcriptional regulator n=1 Tax=unclassified Streptomyces TaxID=2593676 RepID=UPI0036CE750C
MTVTSARLLRMLAVLSSRPSWTNAELAERLGVTERTVRRDIARLRDAGYGIDSETGPYGGYRLGAGERMAPLTLDDEEALAVFAALREAPGDDPAATSALLKLRHLLPARVIERLDAVEGTSVDIMQTERRVAVPLLFEIATACHRGERLTLTYRDARGTETRRQVDPHRLVRSPNRWYLVAFDVTKQEWRTFRADRVVAAQATGVTVELDDPPDAADMVKKMLVSDYPYYATARVAVPLAQARHIVPPHLGSCRADGPDTTFITIGGVTPDSVAAALFRLPTPLHLVASDEVCEAVHRRAAHFIEALQ